MGAQGEGTGRRSWNFCPLHSNNGNRKSEFHFSNNCHHSLVLPCFTPQKRQEEPTTSKDDDDSGDVTWVEFVKGMSSDQFQAWPMFPGDGDQWVEMYSNNAPEWLDFDNFFCGIQHFKQNQNSYEEQSEMDYYRLISMMLGAHCGRSNLAHSWPNHSMSIHQHAKPFLLKIVQKIVKMMFSWKITS